MKGKKSSWRQGWLSVGFWLAASAWLMLIIVGWVLVSTPETGRHSHLVGWTILVIAFVVMVATMDRWIQYAQVFFGFGIIGGLIALTGGRLINSGEPFPRVNAAVLTLLLVGCSLLVGELAKRPLRMIDRVGLVGFVAVTASAWAAETFVATLTRMAAGFGILLALWAYHRHVGAQVASRRTSPHEQDGHEPRRAD